MKTKTLSLIILFTALAAALNIYGPKIPFPIAPFLYFSFWEIPIVIAFLMSGTRAGLIVSAINPLILFAVFPGALPTGPFYNWIAVLSMMLGNLKELADIGATFLVEPFGNIGTANGRSGRESWAHLAAAHSLTRRYPRRRRQVAQRSGVPRMPFCSRSRWLTTHCRGQMRCGGSRRSRMRCYLRLAR